MQEDRDLNINVRELKAIRLGCQVFLLYIEGKVVQILMDNTALLFYINKQGCARSSVLCKEALHLWNFTVQNDIHIVASRLPGIKNALADLLIRSFSSHHKWSLHPKIADMNFQKWGTP